MNREMTVWAQSVKVGDTINHPLRQAPQGSQYTIVRVDAAIAVFEDDKRHHPAVVLAFRPANRESGPVEYVVVPPSCGIRLVELAE